MGRLTSGQMNERQRAIVTFIRDYCAKHGYSPGLREIRDGCGISSVSVVGHHLRRLRAMGRVTWVDGQPRTVRVVE